MIQGRDARKFLGHFKCHSEPQISRESLKRGHVRSSEWIQHLQQKSLGKCALLLRRWKEHILKDTNMTELTFCCKFWVYSLRMTLFGQFWWYLWSLSQLMDGSDDIIFSVTCQVMAYKMSRQEFPTASLDITVYPSLFLLLFFLLFLFF